MLTVAWFSLKGMGFIVFDEAERSLLLTAAWFSLKGMTAAWFSYVFAHSCIVFISFADICMVSMVF